MVARSDRDLPTLWTFCRPSFPADRRRPENNHIMSTSVLPRIERKVLQPERAYWLQTGISSSKANPPIFGGSYLRYTSSVCECLLRYRQAGIVAILYRAFLSEILAVVRSEGEAALNCGIMLKVLRHQHAQKERREITSDAAQQAPSRTEHPHNIASLPLPNQNPPPFCYKRLTHSIQTNRLSLIES
jgi:hypothetical protein